LFSYIFYVLNVPSSSYFLSNSVQTKLSEVYMCLRVVKLYTPGIFLEKREIIERVSFKNVFHFVIYLWREEFSSVLFFQPLLFSHYIFSDCAEHPTHTVLRVLLCCEGINRFNEFRFAALAELAHNNTKCRCNLPMKDLMHII